MTGSKDKLLQMIERDPIVKSRFLQCRTMWVQLKLNDPSLPDSNHHLTTINQVHQSGVHLIDPKVLFYTPAAFETEFGVSHKRLGLSLVSAPVSNGTTVPGIPIMAPGEKCDTYLISQYRPCMSLDTHTHTHHVRIHVCNSC